MERRKRYRKKANQYVVAVQLKLDTSGFTYRKWGAEQRCKSGDWLVDNGGDIYTVDKNVFIDTYEQIDLGRYKKINPIWATLASAPGVVQTKEGQSHYQAGDYLVSNNENGTDAYCISGDKFEAMYELDE
jgi:hypothetical protein